MVPSISSNPLQLAMPEETKYASNWTVNTQRLVLLSISSLFVAFLQFLLVSFYWVTSFVLVEMKLGKWDTNLWRIF